MTLKSRGCHCLLLVSCVVLNIFIAFWVLCKDLMNKRIMYYVCRLVCNSFLWDWKKSIQQGSALSRKADNSEIGSGSSWSRSDSLGPSLSEKTSCKDSQIIPAAWKKQKPAELTGRGLDHWVTLKEHSPIFRLCSLFQAPNFCELSPMLRWALVM